MSEAIAPAGGFTPPITGPDALSAEILTIGDELLSGESADTNSQFLDGRLERWGYMVRRHTTVADDLSAIAEAFRELSARADLVISSGGLGPTEDDLTLAALGQALGVELLLDEPTLERIRARFQSFGRPMTPNNERQARVPARGEVLPNAVGTAPGFRAELGRAQIYLVPGVPREMRWFADEVIGPRVDRGRPVLVRRTLKVMGVGESKLEHDITDIVKAHGDVRFGYRTLGLENHVKLAAVDGAALARAEAAVRERLGAQIYGVEGDVLETSVVQALIARGLSVAVAESCTGGLVQKRITDVAGASGCFFGGVVAYANEVKTRALGVPAELIALHGAVSEEVACAMAAGVRAAMGASFGVSTTGVAGPGGGTPQKPVGLVYVGLSGPAGTTAERLMVPGDREQIRSFSASFAIDRIRRALG